MHRDLEQYDTLILSIKDSYIFENTNYYKKIKKYIFRKRIL